MDLLPVQQEAIRTLWNSTRPLVWAGSIRAGKSTGCAAAMLLRQQVYPGDYILAGRSFNAAMRNIGTPLLSLCREMRVPHKLHRGQGDFGTHIKLPQSRLFIFGANTEASQDVIQGMTARGALLDEALLMPKSFVIQAIARCSMPNARILLNLNKGSPHHWIKRELIDGDKVELLESGLDDNPHIGQEARTLYSSMFAGHFAKRMLENEWADPTGCVFPPLQVRPRPRGLTRRVIAADAATSGTTAALCFAFDPKTRGWVVEKEYVYTGEDKEAHQHAKAISALAPKGDIIVDYAGGSGVLLKKHLRLLGRRVINARKDLLDGLNWTRLAIDSGKVKSIGRCPTLDGEIAEYVWDEKAANQGIDKPVKKADHCCDALRYFVMRHCRPVSYKPVKKPRGL